MVAGSHCMLFIFCVNSCCLKVFKASSSGWWIEPWITLVIVHTVMTMLGYTLKCYPMQHGTPCWDSDSVSACYQSVHMSLKSFTERERPLECLSAPACHGTIIHTFLIWHIVHVWIPKKECLFFFMLLSNYNRGSQARLKHLWSFYSVVRHSLFVVTKKSWAVGIYTKI